jgi:hypothetical protein
MATQFGEGEYAADDPLHEVPRMVEVGAEDLDPRIVRAINIAARRSAEAVKQQQPNHGRITHEGGIWARWAFGLAVGAILTAIGGYVSDRINTQSQLAAMQQGQADMRAQVQQIYMWLAPRYTGNH